MKNVRIIPISIITVILVAFLGMSFGFYDVSESVSISGVSGSYAETFANENNIEFVAIADSENPDVEIPTTQQNTEETTKAEEVTKETTEAQTVKENGEFAYNYDNNAVVITEYKGNSKNVVIPDTIDNLPVKGISLDAVSEGISSIQIPSSVTEINGKYSTSRYDTYFYVTMAIALIGYIFAIIATMIGVRNKEKKSGSFFGISFVYSGLVTFILLSIWSGVALYKNINLFTQVLVTVVILAIASIGLIGRTASRALVEDVENNVKQKTVFIKLLTTDAQTLIAKAGVETKESANKVYEAIRYSDPMSIEALAGVESQITIKFNEYSNAVVDNDVDLTKALEKELLILIEDRNNKCKVMK